MSPSSGAERPLIIAHRGASGEAPENTLGAVRLAFEQQADGVEVDLRKTRDQRIVLMHDANTFRATGRYRRVRRNRLASLQNLKVGRNRKARREGERIPTLEQFLDILPGGAAVMLELKGEVGVLPLLRETLEDAHPADLDVYLLDFRPAMLEAAREVFPDGRLVWNVAFEQPGRGGAWSPDPRTLGLAALDLGVQALNVMACEAVDRTFVDAAHDAGLEVHVWTVNDPEDARDLRDLGVDGIITDFPGRIREALERDR